MTISSSYTSTIEKFLGEYRTRGYKVPSSMTIRSYHNALVQYGRYLDGRAITPALQKGFVEHLLEKHASGYARTVYYATSAFHRWCGEAVAVMHIDASNPQVTQFTDGEWEKLVGACQTPLERAVILTLFESGVRASEALGICWDDLDMKSGFAHITRKGGREGDVPLFERTIAALKVLGNAKGMNGHVFKLDYNQLYFLVRKIGKRVDMRVTPHALRHARASSLRRKGVPLDRIQELLGHTDPKTTSYYYAAITPHQLREDIQKVE